MRKRYLYGRRRGMAILSAAVMAASSLPGWTCTQEVKAADSQNAEFESALLAEFDFENVNPNVRMLEDRKAKAAFVGPIVVEDGDLYLDGTTYLDVTAKDYQSLLTGMTELTVSFDMKQDGDASGNQWPFFAAPSTTPQNEMEIGGWGPTYLGVFSNISGITVERHNGGRKPSISENLDVTGWNHVDVVFAGNSTRLYVDGEMKGEETSGQSVSNILGWGSVLQIGKANWIAGEFYKGWLDNYRIYSRALSAEEVKAETLKLKEEEKPNPDVTPDEPERKDVTDVYGDISKEDGWYVDDVQYVYDKGYMQGMSQTQFGPAVALSRAHFAVILHRMEGKTEVPYEPERFRDVKDREFYTGAVMWASSKDVQVITGYEDDARKGCFGPDDMITREQMAVMMYRYAKYKGYAADEISDMKKFPDKEKVSRFAEKEMAWAVGAGLITGDQEKLNPQGNASRAVCAAVIRRFDTYAQQQNQPPEEPGIDPGKYMEAVRKQIVEYEASGITDETAGVDYGDLQKYTYYSRTAQRNTNVNVLLPAGYSEDEEYPVLYLLHGYWGTEDSMLDPGDPAMRIRQIVGNLIAKGEAKKMIVVFPYIYCSKDKQFCDAMNLENSLNYDNFINDLTTDLMPFIEKNFAVATGRENTAITGFSMGGRESLFIGLTRPDLFGYIGAVCPAPGLTPGENLNDHPGQLAEEELKFDPEKGTPNLIMVSAAVKDSVVGDAPQSYHSILTRNGVDHVWHTITNADHDSRSVRPHVYNFVRSIFKEELGVSAQAQENEWDDYQETDSQAMQEFYRNGIYSMGNTYRLCEKIEKAQRGEKVRIAYLGGSITEGDGLDTCYARRSYEYFADTFGTGSNVEYDNAGLSGTSSAVGLIRAQYDILNDDPDIIFIEFSVNDHPEELYKKSFEGLVRQCLSQKNEPAVIVLINRAQGGYTMHTQMAAVGRNYDVPVLSMDNSLTGAFFSQLLQKSDYYKDEYHPHPDGCKLISDTIAYFYRQALKTENRSESYRMPTSTVYGTEYATATLAAPWELSDVVTGSFKESDSNYRFPYGWKFEKGSANTPMTFKTTGKGIFILYQSNGNQSFGNLKATVNGKTSVISGKRNYAWGGPDTEIAYIQDETGTLDVSMCMEDANTEFSIWGIGVIK